METALSAFLDDRGDTIVFSNGEAANMNPRKRQRPASTAAEAGQLHSRKLPFVSLPLKEHNQSKNQLLSLSSPQSSSFLTTGFSGDLSVKFSSELSVKFGQHKKEINQFLVDQGGQLQRSLAELRQHHYDKLLGAAVQRLQWKQDEVDMASKRATDLENGLARLRAESMAWRAKGVEDEAIVAALRAQLEQAVVGPTLDEECGESPDADPNQATGMRACRWCRVRPATVVMLPCRHLSICSECESTSAASVACPVCCCHWTGSVQVFFS